MKKKLYFLSDTHLCDQAPETLSLFLKLLQEIQEKGEALYILGDLFDVWIGDDYHTPSISKVKNALKTLTQQGIPVFMIPGNRDFLLGKSFCQDTGCHMLKEPTLIHLAGNPTLIMHGDTLCTDDRTYQRYRRFVHSRFVRKLFVLLPQTLRLKIAGGLRQQSQNHQRSVRPALIDVNQKAVTDQMNRYKATYLIHGHTHRPQCHNVHLQDRLGTRYVLGDWSPRSAQIIVADDESIELYDYVESLGKSTESVTFSDFKTA